MPGRNNYPSRQMLRNWAVSAGALLLLWGGVVSILQGQESPSPQERHQAIAAGYQNEAAEMRAAIKRHQLSRDVYRQGTERPYTVMNPQGRKRMVQHCERLITYYADAAKELEAMAAEHEALAKQATSPEPPEGQR